MRENIWRDSIGIQNTPEARVDPVFQYELMSCTVCFYADCGLIDTKRSRLLWKNISNYHILLCFPHIWGQLLVLVIRLYRPPLRGSILYHGMLGFMFLFKVVDTLCISSLPSRYIQRSVKHTKRFDLLADSFKPVALWTMTWRKPFRPGDSSSGKYKKYM